MSATSNLHPSLFKISSSNITPNLNMKKGKMMCYHSLGGAPYCKQKTTDDGLFDHAFNWNISVDIFLGSRLWQQADGKQKNKKITDKSNIPLGLTLETVCVTPEFWPLANPFTSLELWNNTLYCCIAEIVIRWYRLSPARGDRLR